MNVYYAGREEVAGPIVGPCERSFSRARMDTAALMWDSASHHLLRGDRVLYANPGHEVSEFCNRFGIQTPLSARQSRMALRTITEEIFTFLVEATRPAKQAPAVLFIADLEPFTGAHYREYMLSDSLEAFCSHAASIGAACYVACEDPSVLVPSLRGVLDAADYILTLPVPGNSQIRSKETVRYETPDTRISA